MIVGFAVNIFWDPCQLCIESGRTFLLREYMVSDKMLALSFVSYPPILCFRFSKENHICKSSYAIII